MQVSVESTGALERRMKVQVPSEEIEREVESRLKKVGKTTRLDGFRKGKVPFSVVKKRFGGQIHREVLGDMIQQSYMDALREQALNPAGQPDIEPSSMEQGIDLEYTATFEVYPEITITTMDGLVVERTTSAVTDKDLDDMIDTLREQRSTWVETDRAAESGDQITIDFVGSINGEEFEGGKAEDYPVEIGAGQLLPDLESGLVGMSKDEQKTIDVAFPDEYHAEELKGKTASFAVTAKKVSKKELPEVDEEFAKQFGVEDGALDKFRDSVRENMERELEDRLSSVTRQTVLDAFWEANKIELPKALVAQEVESMREESAKRMGLQDPNQLPPSDAYQEQAARRVGLGLLIGEVISGNDIKVDQALVDTKLESIASTYEQNAEIIRQYRSNPQLMQQIEMMVLEEQVVTLMLDKADVTEKEVPFNEAMGR